MPVLSSSTTFTLANPGHVVTTILGAGIVARIARDVVYGTLISESSLAERSRYRTLVPIRLPYLAFEEVELIVFLTEEASISMFDMFSSP